MRTPWIKYQQSEEKKHPLLIWSWISISTSICTKIKLAKKKKKNTHYGRFTVYPILPPMVLPFIEMKVIVSLGKQIWGGGESVDSLLYKEDVAEKGSNPCLERREVKEAACFRISDSNNKQGEGFWYICCSSMLSLLWNPVFTFFPHIFEWRVGK